MVAYCLVNGNKSIFDPAVGGGAFFSAAKKVSQELGRNVELRGCELHRAALEEGRESGITDSDLAGVDITDFVLEPPAGTFDSIVANPPYIRHHRLAPDYKARVRAFGTRLIGAPLDGRAGLHVYFLLRALQLLKNPGGRLAFIMPADTCEGIFSSSLWRWIGSRYRLDAVVTFEADASPFPRVDTNAIIFMIRRAEAAKSFFWARCTSSDTQDLKQWTLSQFRHSPPSVIVVRRQLDEALRTGLSRPAVQSSGDGAVFGDFAKVLRGIATGENEFFFMTPERAKELGLPKEFLVPAVGRTRDVPGDEVTEESMRLLAAKGRPTLLLCLDGRDHMLFPKRVQEYLKEGERRGLPNGALIASRNPWYKMEVRRAPAFLFAYLGRRNARFIRNRAGVVPLTGFLCVYPASEDPEFVDKLHRVLDHPATIANLARVGKSYGSGAIKVEPRALERLPLPAAVIQSVGLRRLGQVELPFHRPNVRHA